MGNSQYIPLLLVSNSKQIRWEACDTGFFFLKRGHEGLLVDIPCAIMESNDTRYSK